MAARKDGCSKCEKRYEELDLSRTIRVDCELICGDCLKQLTKGDTMHDSGKQKKWGHPDFYRLLDQMADLHSRKNHDYAGTKDPLKNLRACERLSLKPFLGVLVRLQDKWSRLEEFVNSGQLMVKNESVVDTLMDNAVYSLLAIILYQEQLKGTQPQEEFVVPEGWVIYLNKNGPFRTGWYVVERCQPYRNLHKNLTLHTHTGFGNYGYGEAPGYWPTEADAKAALQQYLEKTK